MVGTCFLFSVLIAKDFWMGVIVQRSNNVQIPWIVGFSGRIQNKPQEIQNSEKLP
jgi:hypothetical protein